MGLRAKGPGPQTPSPVQESTPGSNMHCLCPILRPPSAIHSSATHLARARSHRLPKRGTQCAWEDKDGFSSKHLAQRANSAWGSLWERSEGWAGRLLAREWRPRGLPCRPYVQCHCGPDPCRPCPPGCASDRAAPAHSHPPAQRVHGAAALPCPRTQCRAGRGPRGWPSSEYAAVGALPHTRWASSACPAGEYWEPSSPPAHTRHARSGRSSRPGSSRSGAAAHGAAAHPGRRHALVVLRTRARLTRPVALTTSEKVTLRRKEDRGVQDGVGSHTPELLSSSWGTWDAGGPRPISSPSAHLAPSLTLRFSRPSLIPGVGKLGRRRKGARSPIPGPGNLALKSQGAGHSWCRCNFLADSLREFPA